MAVKTAVPSSCYEQELLHIIHTLPIERIAQVVDFARYIHVQAEEDFIHLDDESQEDILADEAVWDQQFASTQDGLKRMAERIRFEIREGRSRPMKLTKAGGIIPG